MNLTPREQQVIGVMLIWPGLQDSAYAGLLGMALRTFKFRLNIIREKLWLGGCSRNRLYIGLLALANQLRTPGTPPISSSPPPKTTARPPRASRTKEYRRAAKARFKRRQLERRAANKPTQLILI